MTDVAGQLARLKEQADAATPQPWRHDPNKHYRWPGTVNFEESVFTGPAGKAAVSVARTGPSDDPQSKADAAFIAAAREAVPVLVDALLEVLKRCDEWQGRGERGDIVTIAEVRAAISAELARLGA